jgi:hypothetical protein
MCGADQVTPTPRVELLAKPGSGKSHISMTDSDDGFTVDHSQKLSKRKPLGLLQRQQSASSRRLSGVSGPSKTSLTPPVMTTAGLALTEVKSVDKGLYRAHATPQANGTLLRSSSDMERQRELSREQHSAYVLRKKEARQEKARTSVR